MKAKTSSVRPTSQAPAPSDPPVRLGISANNKAIISTPNTSSSSATSMNNSPSSVLSAPADRQMATVTPTLVATIAVATMRLGTSSSWRKDLATE